MASSILGCSLLYFCARSESGPAAFLPIQVSCPPYHLTTEKKQEKQEMEQRKPQRRETGHTKDQEEQMPDKIKSKILSASSASPIKSFTDVLPPGSPYRFHPAVPNLLNLCFPSHTQSKGAKNPAPGCVTDETNGECQAHLMEWEIHSCVNTTDKRVCIRPGLVS